MIVTAIAATMAKKLVVQLGPRLRHLAPLARDFVPLLGETDLCGRWGSATVNL